MSESLETRMRGIVAEKLKISPEKVTRDANFIDDLGADSLDTMDVFASLEKRLGKSMPEEAANRMKTFGDVLDYFAAKGA